MLALLKLLALLWSYAAPVSAGAASLGTWAKSRNGRSALTIGLGAAGACVLFLALLGLWHSLGSQARTAAAVTEAIASRDAGWRVQLTQERLRASVIQSARDRAASFAADVQRAALRTDLDKAKARVREVERLLRDRPASTESVTATAPAKSAAPAKSGVGKPRDSPARTVVYPQAVAKVINQGRR
jgi:hypothetical protein